MKTNLYTVYDQALTQEIDEVTEIAMSAAQNVVDTLKSEFYPDDDEHVWLFVRSLIDMLSQRSVSDETIQWYAERNIRA